MAAFDFPDRFRHGYNLSLLISFFFITLFLVKPASAQFHQVHIEPDVDNAVKLSFFAPSQGFVAFDKYIGFTTDSGRTFTQKTITTSNVDYNGYSVNLTFGFSISGVKAFDANNIFVYGDYGFQPAILHSADGGNTFKIVYLIAANIGTMTDLAFPKNDNIGYAVFSNNVLQTTDGGQTWSPVQIGDANITTLQFFDDTHGFVFGASGKSIYKTSDGATWQPVNKPAGTLRSVYFSNNTRAWASNTDGTIYLTNNGGISWTQQNAPPYPTLNIRKMQFVNDSTGYAIANGFDIYKTSNSGVIWERLVRNPPYTYLGYSVTDLQLMSNFIWAGGGHGYVALSTNSGGPTIPQSVFAIDTTGLFNTQTIKLINHSRSGYQYNWVVNGQSVSTSYNASFVHKPFHYTDTISLITSNGNLRDTLTQYNFLINELSVYGFTPKSAKQGDVITITGANLDYAKGVEFGGVPAASYNIASATTITAVVGAGASGKVSVYSAVNIGSQPGFTFIPAPMVKSFSPLTAQAGSTITLKGKSFTGATQVTFGGVSAVSYKVISDTVLTAVLGKGNSGSIAVSGPGGTGSIAGFNIIPVIDSFTPTSGGNGSIIGINGSGFDAVTAVTFGGVPAQSFVINSAGLITATVAAGATGVISVTSPLGTYSSASSFTYYLTPVVTSFAPLTAKAGSTITIKGSHFTGTTAVTFGGAPAASFTVVNDSQLTAVLGKGNSGSVAVTSPGGTGSMAGFAVIPVIDSFTPTSGTLDNSIGISGSGLDAVTAVTFGGVPAQSFVIDSASHITATLAAGATGLITVTSPLGAYSSATSFTYYAAPVITSFGPLSGPAGSTVIINGSNFSMVATDNVVYFGGIKATLLAASASALKVTVPVGATYSNITVQTHHLDGVSRLPFTVTFPNGGSINLNSFPSPTTKIAPHGGTTPIVTDIDGDGKPDIVTRNQAGINEFSFQLNTGTSGNFTYTQQNIDGINANAYAFADLDGDGLPELLTVDNSIDQIVVYHNLSTPGHVAFGDKYSFSPIPSFSLRLYSIAATDIDGDGRPDIVVGSNSDDNTIELYRNLCTPGKLSFGTNYSLWPGTVDTFSIADFDGDGKPDLMVQFGTTSGGIDLLINKSTPGNFSFATAPNIFPANPYPVCTGDIDGDGKIDVIIMDRQDNYIDVYRNLSSPGKVSFTPVTAYSVPELPVNAVIADLDGDSKPDIAVNTPGKGVISVFKNISTPGQLSLMPLVSYPSGITISDMISVADVNGDGKGDLLFSTDGNSVEALINHVQPLPAIYAISPSTGIAGDTVNIKGANLATATSVSFGGTVAASFKINADQSITATLGGGATGNVSVVNPTGTCIGPGFIYGNIPSITAFSPVAGNAGTQVTITGKNFDADPAKNAVYFGGAKAAITSASATQLVVTVPTGATYQPVSVATHNFVAYSALPFNLTFKGDTTLDAQSFSKKFTMPGNVVTTGDIDGDGNLDLVFMSAKNELVVARSQGLKDSVAFDANKTIATGLNIRHIYIADIDADGKPDIVCLTVSPNQIIVYRNTSSGSNISFDAGVALPTGGAEYAYLAINDADGDGLPDIVSTNFSQQSLIVYHNTTQAGKIGFAPPVYHYVAYASDDAVLNDMDGDGRAEIISSSVENSSVSVTTNTSTPGNLNFGATTVLSSGTSGLLQVADFDGDGKPDIAAAFDFNFYPTPTFFRNTGAAKLAFSKMDIPRDIEASGVLAADLNGDGKPEFMAVNGGASRLAVMVNAGTPGTIAFNKDYFIHDDVAVGAAANAGDMDQDGKTDLIIASSGTITIYRNIRTILKTLPDTDLKVKFTSASCRGTKNGSISVTAAVPAPYTATVTDKAGNIIATGSFTKTYSATSLDTGYYNICVTDADIAGFQQCFGSRLTEPQDLSAFSVVNRDKLTADIHMSGGDNYVIQVNDETYNTSQADFTVPLQKGNNKLTVSTGKECQGLFTQRITVGNDIVAYPNPFVGALQIDVGTSMAPKGSVEIVDALGRQVFKDDVTNDYGKLNMDLSKLKNGFYVIKLTMDNKQSVYKIWKK